MVTDEYTTAELLSPAGFDYPAGDWSSGNPSQMAFSSIGALEQSATIQKMEYRFKVIAPANAHFEIPYYVHFLAAGSTNEVITTNTLTGVGTGSWAYYGAAEFPPPYAYSFDGQCTNTIGASRWLTLGCGSASGGCALCSKSAGGFSIGDGDYGFYASVSLGGDSFGDGSGSLIVAGASPQPSLVTPAGLEYLGSLSGVERIRNPDGSLRQVKSGQMLANIVVNSGTSYTIQCFSLSQVGAKQNGVYTTSGSPFSTGTIAQGSSGNEILVTVVNGVTSTYDFTWSDTDQGWTLTSGGGLRRESQSWNASALTRTKTIKNSNNQVVYQETQQFQNLGASWGNAMIQRVVGPQGPALTTRWSYYDNAQTDATNFGKIKMVTQPSGAWTTYQYDTSGRLAKTVSQFLNAASGAPESQCRAVTYDYTPLVTNCSCVCRLEKLLGQEISRQYTLDYGSEVRTIQCQTPGTTDLGAANNLVTVARNYYDGNFVGKTKSVLNPDGTMQLYAYATNASQTTTTVLSGQPNSTGTAILDGTQTVTEVGAAGEMHYRKVVDIASNKTVLWDTYSYDPSDPLNRSYTISHWDGTSESVHYGCCGLDTSTDRDGTTTSYLYDTLNRQNGSTRNGISTSSTLDAAGNPLTTIRTGTDNSQITLRQASYDAGGRLSAEINALNGNTTYSQSVDANGQTVKTTVYPDNGTRIETYYQDGSLQSVTGTAVFPVRYEYGVESEGGVQRSYTREIKLTTGGSDTSEWIKTYADMLGRTYKTVYPDSAYSQSFGNNQGQTWKQVDPDNVITFTTYNAKGQPEYTILALSATSRGITDYATLLSSLGTLKAGTDRIARSVSDVTNDNGYDVQRTRTYAWTTVNQDTSVLQTTHEAAVTSVQSWQTQYRDPSTAVTSHSQTTYGANGTRTVTATSADGSYTTSTYQYGRLVSVTSFDSLNSQLSSINYGYDPHGRQNQITDARNGTTSLTYNNADLVYTLTTPVPGAGQAAQTTTTYYNNMLQATSVVQPDNTSTYTEYYPTGLPKKKYGSRTYPVGYSYDYAGRLATMNNWSTYSSGAGARVTTWNYSAYRGWLSSKTYDGNTPGPTYGYTPAGRLQSRTWARGVTTTYGYDLAGGLASLSYSDSTPGVTYGYDRLGRTSSTACNSMTDALAYNTANELLSESFSGGTLAGLAVISAYDQYLRRTSLVLNYQQSTLQTINYTYDTASRLQTVADNSGSPAYSATYTYLANSPLVDHITFNQSGTTRMTTTQQHDYLNRLTQISTVDGGQQTLDSHSYGYNSANQRIRRTLPDTSYWVYTNDSLGQVISGKRYRPDASPVAGQQFEYVFDDIGNRKSTGAGGDQNGGNLRSATYSANSLNQYTSRTVPGYVSSLGTANVSAKVTLWADGGSYAQATRQGNYFWTELPMDNTSHALWVTLTNIAALASNPDKVAKTIGHQFLPYSQEQFSYDADGNLTQDGHWIYGWDAENRLVSLTPSTSYAPQVSLKFEYDSQGRRIRKQVWPNTTWSGNATNDLRFVYDGWNLLAELNTQNSALRTYTWGLDLSGSPQGAGGVGGLLFIRDLPSAIWYCPAFDGSGNVSALISMANGTVAAQYEYGPFGEVIRATGPMAKTNPLRFSTRCQDDETDLLYYGYRYYSVSTGRWLSRDPLAEIGFDVSTTGKQPFINPRSGKHVKHLNRLLNYAGPDLYSFVANDAQDSVDRLGLSILPMGPIDIPPGTPGWPPYPPTDTPPPPQDLPPASSFTDSGVSICNEGAWGVGQHVWLEYPGGSAGFYPGSGGIFPGGVGLIQSPDLHVGDEDKKCQKIGLPRCCDKDKFLNCIKDRVARDQDSPPWYSIP
jgi:RHS repeat-associated protein